ADELGRAVVAEEAQRIAAHVVPIAAVVDVALIVLGGGIGTNADLLLGPIRTRLAGRVPPPRPPDRRGGGVAADRARGRPRHKRRPAAGADPHAARRALPLPAAGRG